MFENRSILNTGMSTFIWTVSDDAAAKLHQLSAENLLSFYRILPWGAFLSQHLDCVNFEEVSSFLMRLRSGLPDENADMH